MVGVQRIVPRSSRPLWLAFLVRATWLGVARWDELRRRGRRRFTRDRVVLGLTIDAVLLVAQVGLVAAARLPWSTLAAPAFLAWYVPLALAIPAALRLAAPLEWRLCEARYRDELARRGWKPALLPAA